MHKICQALEDVSVNDSVDISLNKVRNCSQRPIHPALDTLRLCSGQPPTGSTESKLAADERIVEEKRVG
jgi:hypothetical protein